MLLRFRLIVFKSDELFRFLLWGLVWILLTQICCAGYVFCWDYVFFVFFVSSSLKFGSGLVDPLLFDLMVGEMRERGKAKMLFVCRVSLVLQYNS